MICEVVFMKLRYFKLGATILLCAFGAAAADSTADSAPAALGVTASTRGVEDAPELDLFKDIPVVVAAAKRQQTIQQAPASVSVVTSDDILLFNYRNLSEVLRNQRSFYQMSDGLNNFAGVRGFSRSGEWNARLLVLVDDRPTNEFVYGQTHLDTDFVVPMEAIKQVEIIRGPGSALYGSNAVFGVINVVTKNGADINGAEIKITGGTQGMAQANALMGTTIDGWDILGDFNGYTSQGDRHIHFDDVTGPTLNNGDIDNSDYEGAYEGFIKVRKGEFTAEADVDHRQRDNRDATYLTSFYDTGTMYEQRNNVSVRFDHPVDTDQSLHAMVYYGHYGYKQDLPTVSDPTGLPTSIYTTTAKDGWIGQDVHYDYQIAKNVHLLAGAEGTETVYLQQRDYDNINGQVLNVPSSFNSWALFTQGEWAITDWLSLTSGVRMDQVQRLGTNVSPRFAAVITPNKQDTIKALYGRAFRDPNLYELQYNAPDGNTANPSLKPEIVDTYELVWEREFKDGWRTSLDGYLWKMSQTMENIILPGGSVQTQNTGSSTAEGIEAEIGKRWDKRASFRAYGTYTWSRENSQMPTESPKWILGAALAVPIFKQNTFLAIDPQIVGPMQSDLGQFTRATYVTNVVFTSQDLIKDWTLQAGVYNLFSNNARLPRGGAFEQVQPTLNYPKTQFQMSISHRF
jgi:iron complex outermembrane receptor protein